MMMQKLILWWHFKLRHAGFSLVMWLGKNGYLGTRGTHMGHANCDPIKCGTCNLGKQQKTANPSKHVANKNPGELKKDILQPGQVIFSNQYQMNVPGKLMKSKDVAGSNQPY